jgi:hypothetical protein
LVDFSTHIKGNILDLVLTNIPDRVSDIREEGQTGKRDPSMIVVKLIPVI